MSANEMMPVFPWPLNPPGNTTFLSLLKISHSISGVVTYETINVLNTRFCFDPFQMPISFHTS